MPYLERDGVKLYYEETGAGEPAMLFIHGWTCNHTHWAAQVAQFSKTHRVVTVDLRGHGESDAPQQEYTLEGFADDVAWMIGELGLDRPIVGGHSMGGFVTVMLGKNHPASLRARIIVDSPVIASPGFRKRAVPLIERWRQAEYLGEVGEFIGTMFNELDTPETRAEITAQMLRTPQHVLTSAMWDHGARGYSRGDSGEHGPPAGDLRRALPCQPGGGASPGTRLPGGADGGFGALQPGGGAGAGELDDRAVPGEVRPLELCGCSTAQSAL